MTSTTNTGKQRVTLFLNPKLLLHARAQAIIQDISLTKLIQNCLIDSLPPEIVIKKPKL